MKLFVQNVVNGGEMVLFDDDWSIIRSGRLVIAPTEKHPDLAVNLDEFLKDTSWSEINTITLIHGPGDFTPVRTICVVANTLAAELQTPLLPITIEEYMQHKEKLGEFLAQQKKRLTPKVEPLYQSAPRIG
jgi:hypothetical protein